MGTQEGRQAKTDPRNIAHVWVRGREPFATKGRDKPAALRFMKKLMKRHGTAEQITTDGLRSYRPP